MFKAFLVRFGHIVETSMSFRSVEWGIEFTLTTEIKSEKSHIVASNRIQVSRFVSHRNTKNFGVFLLGRRKFDNRRSTW